MTTPSLDDILAVVDNWFTEEVQRPPVSHHTECYNQMYAARASLRNRLAVAMTGEALPPLAPPPENEEAGQPGAEAPAEPEKASEATGESAGEGPGAPTKSKSRAGA